MFEFSKDMKRSQISARAGGLVELRYIGTWPGNWEGFKLRRMIKLLKFDAQAIQYIIFYAATFIHKLDNYSCIQHAKFVGLHLCHLRGLEGFRSDKNLVTSLGMSVQWV